MFKYPTISALARFINEPETGAGQEAAQRAQTRTGRTDTIKEQREKRIKRRRSR
jgi:hypothetical protein